MSVITGCEKDFNRRLKMNGWSPNALMTDCICPASLAILPGLLLKMFVAQDFLFVFFCFLLPFHLDSN